MNLKMKKQSVIILFFFILASGFTLPPVHEAEGWLSGWNYRKEHNVTGSSDGALTDYQLCFRAYYGSGTDGTETVLDVSAGKVYLNSHSQTDFDDIRVTWYNSTSSSEQECSIWIETVVDSDYCIFWVKAPSLASSPTNETFYIYYGNSGASSASNIDDVFIYGNNMDTLAEFNEDWSKDSGEDAVQDTTSFNRTVIRLNDPSNTGSTQYSMNFSLPNDRKYRLRWYMAGTLNGAKYPWTYLNLKNSTGDRIVVLGARGGDFSSNRVHGASIYTFGTWEEDSLYLWSSIIDPVAGTVLDTWVSDGDAYTTDRDLGGTGAIYTHTFGGVGTTYQGNASMGSYYITEYTTNEPTHAEWGSEEETNTAPTLTSASILDMDDTDNCYAMESYYTFVAVVNDADGATDIDKVYLQGRQGAAVRFEVRATTLTGTPSYAIETGATIIDLDTGSCSWVEDGDEGTATFKIRFEWDYSQEADLEIAVYVEDSAALSAGFTDMQTDYFDVITRLVTSNLAVADSRINKNTSTTFSGNVYYATTVSGDTASTKYPPDAEFTAVHIHNAAHETQGNDTSIVNGAFSAISVTVPDAVQSNTYHVYLDLVGDYTDADSPDGDTVAVIGDRIYCTGSAASDNRININDSVDIDFSLKYDYDETDLTDGSVTIEGFAAVHQGSGVWRISETSASVSSVTYNEFTATGNTHGITSVDQNGQSQQVIWDGLKVDSYVIAMADVKVYIHMRYGYDGVDVNGGSVAFAGRQGTTNSTGWCEFDMSAGSDFNWNQTAYGVQDVSYGITSKVLNQTLPIARKNKLVKSDVEISALDWNDESHKLTVGFNVALGSYVLEVSGSQPVYVLGVSYDLSTDYTTYLSVTHNGQRNIAVAWQRWGDFYIQGVSQGYMSDIYWTDQILTVHLNGTGSGTLIVYCGSRGCPKETFGFSSIPEYDVDTTILSGPYSFTSNISIGLDWTMPTDSGATGPGGTLGSPSVVTFIAITEHFLILQGETKMVSIGLNWEGATQIRISEVKFEDIAEWISLSEVLPKTIAKEFGEPSGSGELLLRLSVPLDAEPGDYSISITLNAEVIGARTTTGTWITFTVLAPSLLGEVSDYVMFLFVLILIALAAYAYVKH